MGISVVTTHLNMLLSHTHPLIYTAAVCYHRLKRHLKLRFNEEQYVSGTLKSGRLEHNVKRHSSCLLKKLGDSEMWLQNNMVHNLGICVPIMDGMMIRPGESFSFCKLIGKPTRKRGFKEGMELSMGKARAEWAVGFASLLICCIGSCYTVRLP